MKTVSMNLIKKNWIVFTFVIIVITDYLTNFLLSAKSVTSENLNQFILGVSSFNKFSTSTDVRPEIITVLAIVAFIIILVMLSIWIKQAISKEDFETLFVVCVGAGMIIFPILSSVLGKTIEAGIFGYMMYGTFSGISTWLVLFGGVMLYSWAKSKSLV